MAQYLKASLIVESSHLSEPGAPDFDETRITPAMLKNEFVELREARKLLGLAGAQYVGNLVKGTIDDDGNRVDNKLSGIKAQLDRVRWMVYVPSIQWYDAHRTSAQERRLILHAMEEDVVKIRAAVDALVSAGTIGDYRLDYASEEKSGGDSGTAEKTVSLFEDVDD